MEPKFVKTGFCPEEVIQLESMISKGYGKSMSDIVRKATLEFILRHGGP